MIIFQEHPVVNVWNSHRIQNTSNLQIRELLILQDLCFSCIDFSVLAKEPLICAPINNALIVLLCLLIPTELIRSCVGKGWRLWVRQVVHVHCLWDLLWLSFEFLFAFVLIDCIDDPQTLLSQLMLGECFTCLSLVVASLSQMWACWKCTGKRIYLRI
jgi:hypothetical protein